MTSVRTRRRQIDRLMVEYNHQCFYCKKQVVRRNLGKKRNWDKGDGATRDHLFPKSKGGACLVLACNHCNNKKGDKPPLTFILDLHFPEGKYV